VKFFVDVAEFAVGYVGVNLGSGNIGVAKHALHSAQVGAVAKKVGRERVTQNVRGNLFLNAAENGVFFYNSLDMPGG
jgi:deoxyinosine 3'endonuclease (endonuclease V)